MPATLAVAHVYLKTRSKMLNLIRREMAGDGGGRHAGEKEHAISGCSCNIHKLFPAKRSRSTLCARSQPFTKSHAHKMNSRLACRTNGQICSSTSRAIIHENIAPRVLERLKQVCSKVVACHPLTPEAPGE